MIFRHTRNTDADAVRRLFMRTFSDSKSSEEGVIVGDLAYQLVEGADETDVFGFLAEHRGVLTGCIAFSRDQTHALFLAMEQIMRTSRRTRPVRINRCAIDHCGAKKPKEFKRVGRTL